MSAHQQHQQPPQQQQQCLQERKQRRTNLSSSMDKSQAQTLDQQQMQNAHFQPQQAFNGKDLIIRMLAEVFQVNQTPDGQVRWEQISTSLVPVSLYSKTTSKWLNYLLSASSAASASANMVPAATSTSAMSPDSRDFLLLLQQFHQQSRAGAQQQLHPLQSQHSLSLQQHNVIVFQVVAHDFIDGLCKKILNVKLAQPGTRLGQASDYFVYWKGQNSTSSTSLRQHQQYHNHLSHSQAHMPQHQFSTSSVPPLGRQNLANNPIHHSTGYSPLNINNSSDKFVVCCNRSNTFSGETSTQTWGLNFASVNDAKLFYDICSLNLVDLDFNSNYIKQLAMSDKNFDRLNTQQPINYLPSLIGDHRQHDERQNYLEEYLNDKQLRKLQQRQQPNTEKFLSTKQQQLHMCQLQHQPSSSNAMKHQLSTTKCPACNLIPRTKSKNQQFKEDYFNVKHSMNGNLFCPLHLQQQQSQDEKAVIKQELRTQQRTRSRSTTRQASEWTSMKRARSFSTPASPDGKELLLSLNQPQTNSTEYQQHGELLKQQHQHHPRCASFIRNQKREQIFKQQLQKDSEKPQKPARGVLRDNQSSNLINDSIASFHQGSINSNQILHTERTPKPQYLSKMTRSKSNVKPQTILGNKQPNLDYPIEQFDNFTTQGCCSRGHRPFGAVDSNKIYFRSCYNQEAEPDTQITFGRSTSPLSNDTDELNSASHRNARLARAQYANSKNMKEFLSLDAGGMHSTPTQLAALNRRFQEQLKTSESRSGKNESGRQSGQVKVKKRYSSSESFQKPTINDDLNHNVSNEYGDLSNNHQDSSIKGQKDANLEKRRVKLENEGDSSKNNVSTTTEDLPLDSVTRKRMFRLTSEEVISEKTEPKSASSVAVDVEHDHLPAVRTGSPFGATTIERTERAVSLGPEVERALRGRSARSDAGRRRSLERSMCVDLDSSLPLVGTNASSSSMRKSYGLSPLLQSNGPMIDESFKSSPSIVAPDGNDHQPLQKEFRRMPLRNEKEPRFTVATKRAKIKSSSSKSGDYCLNSDRKGGHQTQMTSINHDDNIGFDSMEACRQHQLRVRNDLVSFKSVPDMSTLSRRNDSEYLDFNSAQFDGGFLSGRSDNFRSPSGGCQNQFLNETITMQPKTAASLSSYAVPLCSLEREQQCRGYSRQFHSCPNSLRRKRRGPYHQSKMTCGIATPSASAVEGYCKACFEQSRNSAQEADFEGGDIHHHISSVCRDFLAPKECRVVEENCSFCQNQMVSSGLEGVGCSVSKLANICSSCNFQVASATASKNLSSICSTFKSCTQLQQQHQRQLCQAHNRFDCVTNVTTEPLRDYVGRAHPTTQSDCPHSSQITMAAPQHRPYSSQSSRSPIRLGLYDSDDEADEQYSMQNICPTKGLGDQEMSYCKLGCSQTPLATKCYRPVRGYDQTMSRTSLKNRQRAKSQPPDEVEQENDTAHLTKSMRNVQKLINEVQNELDSLRKRPLATAQASDGLNGKNITLFSTVQPYKRIAQDNNNLITFNEPLEQLRRKKTSNPVSSTANQKMSNDEGGAQYYCGEGTELRETMATQGGMSAGSATKRAGQFKCVGAIRKAGFLSVKKWILKRRQSIELARKQGWKRYWVCLRGTAMLFHSVIDKKDLAISVEGEEGVSLEREMQNNRTDLLSWIQTNCPNQVGMIVNLLQKSDPFAPIEQKESNSLESILKNISQCYIEKEPRHLIIIEDSIAQPIPEHPKRDYVFCLSTTFGDAYLFQSSCQSESENWIAAIHNACAASIARDLTRDEAIKLFQTKVRQLELEVEKKLFLRQRLESRLTSMASMSHISNPANLFEVDQIAQPQTDIDDLNSKTKFDDQTQRKLTMRTLLHKLNQQLIALDTYIEQVHCEIYQLRCYLSSCGSQNIFYQNIQNQAASTPGLTYSFSSSFDLPHPRSLLMNVSKPTKLLLIKLGVFTVSSFHAYIHARQGSADTILKKIQQQSTPSKPLELRVRSQSISDSLFRKDNHDNKLEDDTEHLIYMANLKAIKVKVNRKLYFNIKQLDDEDNQPIPTKNTAADSSSDDRYSILDEGDFVVINLKLHSSSSSLSIIKQVLSVIDPNISHLSFLKYYLRFNIPADDGNSSTNENPFASNTGKNSCQTHYITKRKEMLNDWLNFEYLELVEKIVFKVELVRRQMDEETSPFGITVGAQLFASNEESLLNVYCSYIEWGSVSDKAGLKDDDEFLMINGVSVMDLDMMFIECILRDETKLRLLVRSSRTDPPSSALLNNSRKHSDDDDNDDAEDDENEGKDDVVEHESRFKNPAELRPQGSRNPSGSTFVGSQVISDEYISSLVCPPPPALTKAFLRTDSSFVRQKSELCSEMMKNLSPSGGLSTLFAENKLLHLKSKSQQNLPISFSEKKSDYDCSSSQMLVRGSVELASQLIKKTEQLTQLLGKNSISSWNIDADEKEQSTSLSSTKLEVVNGNYKKMNLDSVERLRKSILELLETEYAYIKHLETIAEHYMNPLEEMSYLNIQGLRQLNQIIIDLITFQREFFDQLTRSISSLYKFEPSKLVDSELDELNDIIQHLEKLKVPSDFQPLLRSISKIFLEEAEKFKIYASYCASYSRLQKLLHPKSAHSFSSPSTLVPNTLDTFLSSSNFGASTTTIYKSSVSTHRDFLKPLGSFMTHAHNSSETGAQLKQLSDFLGHLDSSSSSATSISLPKSSQNSASDQVSYGSESGQKKSSHNKSTATTFQKSVHQQNFESYLIKPIQRIVRYPMLLNSMALTAQACLDKDDDVHFELRDAVKSMESVTSHVNDTQKVYDEYGQIFANIERQFFELRVDPKQTKSTTNLAFSASGSQFGPHQPPISLTIEQLLYFGEVEWLNINEFTSKVKKEMDLTQLLFVFTSCVVFICKEQVKCAAIKKKLLQSTISTGTNNTHNTSTRSTNPPLNNGISSASSTKLALHKALISETSNEYIRYQSIIPVSEVQVRSVPTTSSNTTKISTNQYQWELFQCSSINSNSSLLTKSNKRNTTTGKVYLLSSTSKESRNAFLRKIRFIIRESVRNMSLPLARSPSTKSSTPKKLSSPISGVNTNSTCSHSTSLSPVCASIENRKDDTKDDSAECAIFVKQVDNNGARYKTSIEVNN